MVAQKAGDVQIDFCCPTASGEDMGAPDEGIPKAFILFIDLRKAYDSVPHWAMWLALAKLGVPSSTIQLIQSFH